MDPASLIVAIVAAGIAAVSTGIAWLARVEAARARESADAAEEKALVIATQSVEALKAANEIAHNHLIGTVGVEARERRYAVAHVIQQWWDETIEEYRTTPYRFSSKILDRNLHDVERRLHPDDTTRELWVLIANLRGAFHSQVQQETDHATRSDLINRARADVWELAEQWAAGYPKWYMVGQHWHTPVKVRK